MLSPIHIATRVNLQFASLSNPIYNMQPSWHLFEPSQCLLSKLINFMHTFMEKHNAGNS